VSSGELLVSCVAAARTHGRGRGAVVAVHGAYATVRRGDRIAVIGPSGSGKSTLLHLMAGLEEPTAGTVSWPGWLAGPVSPTGAVGLVFQGPSLLPDLDAVQNVALPLLLAGVPEAAALPRAETALARLGIGTLATRLPAQMSGGQAQRVAVARVLAARPTLILADEPTGQLDRVNADRVLSVLIETADELDAGLVVATHDEVAAARLARRWRMADGRLLVDRQSDRSPIATALPDPRPAADRLVVDRRLG
jgi:putative ABC transport system ATP-binding protein